MKPLFSLILALAALAGSAALAEITVTDAIVRSASPVAKTAAAYLTLHNSADADDRLIAVETVAAQKAEVHTHIDLGNGVMQMRPVEGGLVIPAQGARELAQGGDHVMLMGLTGPLTGGAGITLILRFETADALTVEVPVDRTRP